MTDLKLSDSQGDGQDPLNMLEKCRMMLDFMNLIDLEEAVNGPAAVGYSLMICHIRDSIEIAEKKLSMILPPDPNRLPPHF